MAGPVSSTAAPSMAHNPGVRYGPALGLLASLFFMWGFITVINNTLLPHLRSVFDLNYTQTTLIESVWFIAYFVASRRRGVPTDAALSRCCAARRRCR